MAEMEITLFPEITMGKKAALFPEHFPQEWKNKLLHDFDEEFGPGTIDLNYAIRVCRDWSHGGGKKRIDWVAVIRNGVRKGWLRPEQSRRSSGSSNAVKGALRRLNQGGIGGPK